MTITNAQFNKLNEIALVLVRKVDTKTYEEMCEILSDIYKTDIAESEECAKEIPVGSLVNEDDSVCPRDYTNRNEAIVTCSMDRTTPCDIRGYHKHTDAF